MMQEVLRTEFERLMRVDQDGLLKPEAIVMAAAQPGHPFHDYFTWDDTEAARRWRLEQARFLIKSYKIDVPTLTIKVRALTSLETDRNGAGGFRWTTDVIADSSMRSQLLATALRDLEALESKYAHLEDLAKVWDAAHSVASKV